MKRSLLTGLLAVICSLSTGANVKNLRCEYLTDPMGIDILAPNLSWIMESDRRGESQTAYQVIVASSPEKLAKNDGNLWNSGKVASDKSSHIEYSGKPLTSGMRCYWKVRVWDSAGKPQPWSEPAMWSMGLLGDNDEDWEASWIGVEENDPGEWAKPRYMRKEFNLKNNYGYKDRQDIAVQGDSFEFKFGDTQKV